MIKNILVIEDEEELSNLLKYSFELSGYSAKAVRDLKQVYDIIKNEKIDLLISDVFLNDRNILSELKKIKKQNPELKIIVTTAFDEIENEIKKTGFIYFLKPYKMESILEEITHQ